MRIANMLKMKKYTALVALSAVIIGIFLPVIQTRFLVNTIDLWFLTLLQNPFNAVLYIIFSIVFGVLVALQVYNQKACKTCNVKAGSSAGAAGAFFGFLVGVCPACIGLIGLILPLGAAITLTYYGWLFTVASIGIMLAALYLLGGFKEE